MCARCAISSRHAAFAHPPQLTCLYPKRTLWSRLPPSQRPTAAEEAAGLQEWPVEYFPNQGITKCSHTQALPVLGTPVFTPVPKEAAVPAVSHKPRQRIADAAKTRFLRAQVRHLTNSVITASVR